MAHTITMIRFTKSI